jgi:hypothetical protein
LSLCKNAFSTLKIPYKYGQQNDSNCHIFHNWDEAIVEVETWNLAVPTDLQSSLTNTILIDLKQQYDFDKSTTHRHLGLIDFLPNSKHSNFLKLFFNGTSPLSA